MMGSYPQEYKKKFTEVAKNVDRSLIKEYAHHCVEFIGNFEMNIDFNALGLHEEPEQASYRISVIELQDKLSLE